jgi:hypothetical protein
MMRENVSGTVYLLCFTPGLRVTGNRFARHYLGWTEGAVDDRVATHLSGQGSPLVKAALSAGCEVECVRTWEGVDRYFERKLKRQRCAPRLCPTCTSAPISVAA